MTPKSYELKTSATYEAKEPSTKPILPATSASSVPSKNNDSGSSGSYKAEKSSTTTAKPGMLTNEYNKIQLTPSMLDIIFNWAGLTIHETELTG